MKFKEREKILLEYVKQLSKDLGWKFKGYFIFKKIDTLYFSSTFYASRLENTISGWLGYKPFSIDDVFWDIIDEPGNKKMPLSFRGEAAFCVKEINFFDYKIAIQDVLNPQPEIIELLKTIDVKVNEKARNINSLEDFRNELLIDEKKNSVGIVTSHIEEGMQEKALSKIEEYRLKNFNSGFRFGDKDFYDLAKEYCEKNYR